MISGLFIKHRSRLKKEIEATIAQLLSQLESLETAYKSPSLFVELNKVPSNLQLLLDTKFLAHVRNLYAGFSCTYCGTAKARKESFCNHYCPILLINVDVKIYAKMIAPCFVTYISTLVNREQVNVVLQLNSLYM